MKLQIYIQVLITINEMERYIFTKIKVKTSLPSLIRFDYCVNTHISGAVISAGRLSPKYQLMRKN